MKKQLIRRRRTAGGGGAGGFSVADLPGLAAWYDPSDASTLTVSGTDVLAVSDKAGSFDLSQGTAIRQADITAEDGLDFVTGFMSMSSEVTGVRSVLFVTRSATESSASANVCPILGAVAANDDAIFLRTNNVDYSISIDGGTGATGAAGLDGQLTLTTGTNIDLGLSNAGYANPHLWAVEYDSGNTFGYLGRFDTGSNFFTTAEIAEVIICTSLLSESDRQKTEGYLAHKWGTEANLPAGHPYKAGPPA